MKLFRLNHHQVIMSQLVIAQSFWQRLLGLMGKKRMDDESALWIHKCNSIHTCFMNFSIDAVFCKSVKNVEVTKTIQKESETEDKREPLKQGKVPQVLTVVAVKENIKPWRLILPVWKATSVIEINGGVAASKGIQKGDLLYVGD